MATTRKYHQVRSYPTPLPVDVIFYELIDSTMPAYRGGQWQYGDPHTDSVRFPNHRLSYVRRSGGGGPRDGSSGIGNEQEFYYVAERETQDEYNFEFRPFPIAGFRLDSVVRTYVNLREGFDNLVPASATAMPDVPVGMFVNEWILFDIEQKRSTDPILDSLFVVEERTYIQRYVNKEYTYDDFFGAPLYETQYICHKDESVFDFLSNPDMLTDITVAALFDEPENQAWGLQSNGKFRGGARINDDWYLLFERDTVPPWMVETGRTYASNVDFSWPAVLEGVIMDVWPLKAGGQEIYPRVGLLREAYRGSTRASIFQRFYKDQAEGEAALGLHEVLNPTPIQFSCPFFSLSIGPTLHAGDTIDIITGTEHPKYAYAGDTWIFNATNYEDWPEEMIASDELKPFRGGFLREQVTVYRPEFLEPPP